MGPPAAQSGGAKTKAESVSRSHIDTIRRLTSAVARPGAGPTNSGGSEGSWPQPRPEPIQEPEHRGAPVESGGEEGPGQRDKGEGAMEGAEHRQTCSEL